MNAKAKIQAQLSAYLDGELDEAPLRQVEEALENDGDLRAELADLAAARKLLRDLPAEKPPLDLVSRVLAEAERSQLVGSQATETSPSPLRWIRYAASAAVLLVAATVGMVIAITLCPPEMYKDNLSRRTAPDIRDDKTNVAVASGKRTGRGEELDRDELGKLAIRSLPTDGTPDGRELRGGGGGDLAGRTGIDGKLGKFEDSKRSPKPGPGGAGVSGKTYDGDTTVSAGTLAKSGAGALTAGDTVTRGGISDVPGVIASKDVTGALGIATKGGTGGRDDNRNEAMKGALAKGHGDNDADAVSGRFRNVEGMSRVLAGDTTNNTIIYTDRLDQTQQQVEKVLGANGIVSAVSTESEQPVAAKGRQSNQARGNFYVSNTLSPAQVQYEAYVTPEQMTKVQKDLDSLRARQNVSQDVPALAYNGESARDGGWNYKKDQTGKDGYYGKASEKPSNISIAKTDGDRTFGQKIAAPADMPVATATPLVAPAAKPAATPAPTAPVAEPVPPAPVVVGLRRTSDEEAGEKYKQDVHASAKPGAELAKATDKDKTQPAKALAKPEGQQAQVQAKPDAQLAQAPESGSGSAGAYRGQSANEPLRDTETRREVAQTRPATQAANMAAGGRAIVPTPSEDREAKLAAEPVAAKPAGKTGDSADFRIQSSTRPAERPAGQAAGPVGGQYAAGTPNPPTVPPAATPAPATTRQGEPVVQAPPAPAQAPVTIRPGEQGEPVVQVGIVKEAPPTQSGGTVAVQIASQPGQAGQLFENTATARVQRLVITLNYRQAGENDRTLDRAKFSAAATSQAAPSQAAPANKAAQETKQQESPTRSK
jgi:flagellar hook-length control protein FliK